VCWRDASRQDRRTAPRTEKRDKLLNEAMALGNFVSPRRLAQASPILDKLNAISRALRPRVQRSISIIGDSLVASALSVGWVDMNGTTVPANFLMLTDAP
jgi:hypothetical protein